MTTTTAKEGEGGGVAQDDLSALLYIVVTLLFYSMGIVVGIITYLKRERADMEEEKVSQWRAYWSATSISECAFTDAELSLFYTSHVSGLLSNREINDLKGKNDTVYLKINKKSNCSNDPYSSTLQDFFPVVSIT